MSLITRAGFWKAVQSMALGAALAACSSDRAVTPEPRLAPGFPAGWVGESPLADIFDVGLDTGIRHGGSASAYLRSIGPLPDSLLYITLRQSVRADDLRGKRLRFTGYLNAPEPIAGTAGLWLRVDGPHSIVAFDNTANRVPSAPPTWRLHSIVADIPAEAIGVSFGIVLTGPGDLRGDDLRFDVVDASVPTTAVALSRPAAFDSATAVQFYATVPRAPVNLNFETRSGQAVRVALVR